MRIIFAIHGIQSRLKDNWIFDFENFTKKDPRFQNNVFIPYYYGFVNPVLCAFPTYKKQKVDLLKEELRKIIRQNAGNELNIVAHSYGTELSFWAIKSSGEDGKPVIKVNKLILVASVVSRHNYIPYNDTLRAGKIKAMHCYCSYEDEVVHFLNPFGRSGYSGFSKDRHDRKCYSRPFDDLEIYNHQVNKEEHCDYFKKPKYYQEWLDIIAG